MKTTKLAAYVAENIAHDNKQLKYYFLVIPIKIFWRLTMFEKNSYKHPVLCEIKHNNKNL